MSERQSDFELLQQFARAGNQNAFRDLVRRHVDLVFATALHKVGDAGGAEDISQNVFGVLARKAWQFAPDDFLPAWLHKTTLLESKLWLRGLMRRRRREQAAVELGTTMKTSDEQTAFNALVPLLDEALLSLRDQDRTALLLRFYEKQSLSSVGATLGVSEDTAQKRVQTALAKLSQFFQRRGFKTATTAAAAAALQHTAVSASAATTSLVFSAVLKAAPPALAGLGGWLARFASLTKVQTAAVCIAIAVVPVAWKWEHARETANAAATLQVKLAALHSEQAEASAELEKLRNESVRLEQKQFEATQSQTRAAEASQKLASLKVRSRALLAADNYRWPDDLPFVRVPKSALAVINVGGGPNTPDKLATKIGQFLDLSAQEREVTAQIFTNYFAELNRLIETSLYETNRSSSISLPPGAESKVFVLLPLGEKIRTAMGQLCADLETALGSERWAMVKPDQFEFTHYEQVRLLGYASFNWDKQEEIAVNIFQAPGVVPTISWTGSDGTGCSPMPLSSSFPFLLPQGPPMLIEMVKQYCLTESKARLSNPATK
jgi:RNA polymerase sigma factor (sigma-70 family)